MTIGDQTEWLEADGLGGFASGTTSGIRTRRYHALLLAATTPPTGRVVLVNGFDAWVDTPNGTFALSTQRYAPDVLHPDGAAHLTQFTAEPWPTWEYHLADGTRIIQEIFVQHEGPTIITWTLARASGPIALRVRPFLSGRDYHSLHHENGAFRFAAERRGAAVEFSTYDGLPGVTALTDGEYHHAPEWYRQFSYSAERERGLDAVEDLASPGEFAWRIAAPGEQAAWLVRVGGLDGHDTPADANQVRALITAARSAERRRRDAFATPLDRAADAYVVRRGSGQTIVAGYPWFTDWGRDTFIAIRGLCLATGRLADARNILIEWAGAVSDGMLPNLFTDQGGTPEFNAVDASLWYVIAVHELLALVPKRSTLLTPEHRRTLETAIVKIVDGYARGTRFGIRMDGDGLLAAGVDGVQLTWMDARVGDRVITPRIGKPVEIQALWLNAVWIAARQTTASAAIPPDTFSRGRAAFVERFWNEERGRLADVVDVGHVAGTRDDSFRPNQILAVGGLPIAVIEGERARRVVDAVEQQLVTPIGLRSLAPGEPGYAARYEGPPWARDAVYHQGTVWPWLIGPFVEAWIRVRGNTGDARREARQRFLAPLCAHLQTAGLGHVSEIADAEPPFTPRGCPFQAWSLGELLRLDRTVLVEPKRTSRHVGAAQSV